MRILGFFLFGVAGGPLLLIVGFYLYAHPSAFMTLVFIVLSLAVIPTIFAFARFRRECAEANAWGRAAYQAGVERSVRLELQGRGRGVDLVAGAPTERS